MSDQPEALKLAGELVIESEVCSEAAAELRRQHEEITQLRAERDALKQRLQLHDACNGVMGERGYVPECISLHAECDALRSELATLRAQNYETQSLLNSAEAQCDALRERSKLYEQLREVIDNGSESMTHEDAVEELTRLRAECDALRADAERYRWLRVQHWSDSSLCVVAHPRSNLRRGTYCPSAKSLDELADAARAALKEAKP